MLDECAERGERGGGRTEDARRVGERLTERCAATFRRGRGVRSPDLLSAVDLTTARPIGTRVTIVYTLPIGSLFLSRATDDVRFVVRDDDVKREACHYASETKEGSYRAPAVGIADGVVVDVNQLGHQLVTDNGTSLRRPR